MRFDFDSGKLLYVFGVVFAVAALVYFVQDLVFGLSITVKAILLFLGFVGFFLAGTTTDRDGLDAVAFALSGAAYLVFLAYVVWRYDVGQTGIFLLLAFSAALFIGLGYLLREHDVRTPARTAGYLAGVLLLVSVALIGADAAGGGVTYDVQTEESVSVGPAETAHAPDGEYRPVRVSVGSVTASNEFVFRRALDLPSLSGCIVGADASDERFTHFRYDRPTNRQSDTIGGSQTLTVDVEATVPFPANTTEPIDYAVERRTNCPDRADQPTIVVITDGGAD